jgi:PAS domain S-box-containing protein
MAMESAARPRVLIVGENAETRLHVQRVLNSDYEVHAVSDGDGALAAARENAPDLVLSDSIMPQLDGIGLLQALRADPRTRDIPVILLSASANEDSRLDALKAGAADYLTKPFGASELLARIKAQLEIARLRREKLELDLKLRTSADVAQVEVARKNHQLRRARNALQRELASRTEDVSQLTQELIADRQTMLAVKDELAADLTAMTRLYQLSTRLLDHTEIKPLLEEVLDATMVLLNADFGNVQLYDSKSHALRIVAQRGFKQDFSDYFDSVQEGTASCGTALLRKERVVVEDVLTDPSFAPHLEVVVAAGYRAVQSTPLFSRGGEPLGMISTHFRNTHRLSERELGLTDLYARQAAEMIERKRAEEKLRRSEAYLAEAQRLSRTASWAWNASTGESYWSAELFRIYGLDPDKAMPGYPAVLNYIHPEDRSLVQRTFEDAVREQRKYELAYRVVGSDGTIRHVNNLAHPVFNEAGDLIEYVGTTIDTTERVQAEEKLRRSEANLAEGQRISHTGSWAWNASSGEIFSSQELLRIFGLEAGPSTLTHETFVTLIHPEDRSRVRQAFDDAVRNNSNYEAEYRFVRADSSIRHVHNLAHPVFNEWGVLVEYIGTAMDITERKQAEDQVRKAHEQVDMVLDSISDNFFGLSSDGRFTYFNKQAAKQMQILGKDPAHLIGKVAWEKFPDMPNKENVQRVLTKRIPITDELYYAPLDEWVENHMYPSHDGGLVTFQRYITARKRTEEELRKTRAELGHVTRLTTMVELAASIAHEINQPLGAVVNNSNVALRLASAADDSRHELVEVLFDIVNDANRASAIIARIRAVMRKSAPEKTSLRFKDVVADVLAVTQRELAERRIEVRTELPEDLPSVSADRVQLRQALLNLVMNGIEAMESVENERRILTIRVQRDALEGQPAVLITVRDFGSGFSPEDREHLFDVFYTTKPEGMGMGLRISRSIIEAHGGRLWAQANEDMGATFLFSLPAEIPETL